MQRPTSATVFGILNIIYGCFGILGILLNVALIALGLDLTDPWGDDAGMDWFGPFTLVSTVLGGIAAVCLVISGIGLLRMREWARKLAIGYGIYGIISTIAGAIVTIFFLLPAMTESADHEMNPGVAIGAAVGGAIGSVIGLAFPVLLIVFMMRKTLRDAFNADERVDAFS